MQPTLGIQSPNVVFNLCLLLSTLSTCATVGVNTTSMTSTSQSPAELSLRLVRGYSASSGRVEIFNGGEWGKLCLPRFVWTKKEAMVTCRQLGYPSALSSWEILEDYSMDGVVTFDFSCFGNETLLTECAHDPLWAYYCGRGFPNLYQVLVVCEPNEGDSEPPYLLKLIHGREETEGNIELMPFESAWMVCSDSFDAKDAAVVCRELGYEYAIETFTDNHFFTDQDSFPYALRFPDCVGNEKYLLECPHRIIPGDFCEASVGGVKCSLEPSSLPGEEIRLAGSADADEGHLQTFYNGQWWNICNDGLWSEREAEVTCRSLGYATGWPLYTLRFTQEYKDTSSGDALITGFRCQGTESNLTQCLFDVSLTAKCGFYDIAAVHCSATSLVKPTVPYGVKIRLKNGLTLTSGRVEIYQDDQWWSVCGLSGWNRKAARVVCHQLGFNGAIYTDTFVTETAYGKARSDTGILYSAVECTGQEQRLDQCKVSMETSECSHDNDVNLKCFESVYVDENIYTTAKLVTSGGPTMEEGYTINAGGVNWRSDGTVEPTGEITERSIVPVAAIVTILLVCVLMCIILLIVVWRVIKARNSRATCSASAPGVSWSRDGQQSYQSVPGKNVGAGGSPAPVGV